MSSGPRSTPTSGWPWATTMRGMPIATAMSKARSPTSVVIGHVAICLPFAIAVLVSRSLQRQIDSFLQAARRLGSGDFTIEVPPSGHDEFAALEGAPDTAVGLPGALSVASGQAAETFANRGLPPELAVLPHVEVGRAFLRRQVAYVLRGDVERRGREGGSGRRGTREPAEPRGPDGIEQM